MIAILYRYPFGRDVTDHWPTLRPGTSILLLCQWEELIEGRMGSPGSAQDGEQGLYRWNCIFLVLLLMLLDTNEMNETVRRENREDIKTDPHFVDFMKSKGQTCHQEAKSQVQLSLRSCEQLMALEQLTSQVLIVAHF